MALVAIVMPFPLALSLWLTPDSITYIGTAHSWVHGAGFVDPILFTHYLADARPPVPAFAIVAPVLPVLLAAPLALGADLSQLAVTHLVWAGLIGGSAVLAASRSLSLPAATAFGLAVAWSPGFGLVAATPWTEATAVGFLLLVLALVRQGTGSVRGALLLSGVTLLAWMTRPNLGLIVAVVPVSVMLARGPRAALRSRPLWVYVGSFVLLHRAVVIAVTAATGFAPLAQYGAMAQIADVQQIFEYRREWVGPLAFVREHFAEILTVLEENLGIAANVLFLEDYHLWVGWLALPGLGFALLRRGPRVVELRFAAVAAIAFTLVALGVYGGFDRRYLLPGVVCCWFTIAALAERGAERLADRLAPPRAPPPVAAVARWLPALAAVAIVAAFTKFPLAHAPLLWTPLERHEPHDDHQRLQALCSLIDPDALVSSTNPWALFVTCGNAGLRLPNDLGTGPWVPRYLDEQEPGYLLVKARRAWRAKLELFPQLRHLKASGAWHLYEVVGAGPASRPWRAPPSLASLQD